MAKRKIIRDEDTREVILVRSVTVEVKREKDTDFFLCSINNRLRGRSRNIEIATKAMKNSALRRQIIAIFMASGDRLKELIWEQFPEYDLFPRPSREERRLARRHRHKFRASSANFARQP